MNIVYRLKGNWNNSQLKTLAKAGISTEFPYILLSETKSNSDIWNRIDSSIIEKTAVFSQFSTDEIKGSDSWLLKEYFPRIVYPYQPTTGDAFEYLKYAYGDFCESCRLPKGKQINPLILSSEPSKLSKNHLFGAAHWSPNFLITDIERFKIIKSALGINSIPLLIGKSRRESKNYVQIEIPVSSSNLYFGSSKFGTHEVCQSCKSKNYSVKQLDYFPSFEESQDLDICHTKEWFGSYRQLIIRKSILDFLEKRTDLKLNTEFLIPTKDYRNLV